MPRMTVNGQPVHYRMDAGTPLLWALRDASNLTGTKYGCGIGRCGACTVHIDGQAVRSCQISLAEAEGAFVTTIEALSRSRGHPVQQAWIENMVPQCGYCQSGVIMAVAALIERNANPTDEEIDEAITNICRCGTSPRWRESIRLAARVARGEARLTSTPPPGIERGDAARNVEALTPPDENEGIDPGRIRRNTEEPASSS